MAGKDWLIPRTDLKQGKLAVLMSIRFRTCGCDQGFPIALDLRSEYYYKYLKVEDS